MAKAGWVKVEAWTSVREEGPETSHSQAMSKSVKYCFSPLAQIAFVPT